MTDDEKKSAHSQSLVSISVSDVFGIGKAAEKLSPAANKILEGLAKVVDPALSAAKIYMDERARGAAIRHETKSNIQQINSIENLLVGDPQLAEQMRNRLVATEMRRQANIHHSVEKALALTATATPERSLQDLDEDFVQEWVEGVKDVSNEIVQSIWAALLANSPAQLAGRISKPALELLKQFDQPTALMFLEFAKVWTSVGCPSIKAPARWAPFGTPINFPLLKEIGVIEETTYRAFSLPGLGYISQVRKEPNTFKGFNTLQVYVWGHRAYELGNAILQHPFEIDEHLVLAARKQNVDWLTNDDFWYHALMKDEDAFAKDIYSYIISPKGQASYPTNETVNALKNDAALQDSWREVLIPFAEAGRLAVCNTFQGKVPAESN